MTQLIQLSQPSPVSLYTAGQAVGARKVQSSALETIARLLSDNNLGYLEYPWHTLDYATCRAIMVALQNKYAPSTVNRMFSAVRGVLRECRRLGLISHDQYENATDIKPSKDVALPVEDRGRHLSPGEIRSLIEVCVNDRSLIGRRNAALIVLALATGLRRAELVDLKLADIDFEGRSLMVHRGKGGRKRKLPMAESAVFALRDWVEVRGDWPGWLFTRVRKGGEVQRTRLSTYSVQQIMELIAHKAKVADFRPHDLRRTFAGNLLDVGADMSTVQKLMGHASPVSTAAYDKRSVRARREAVDKLHIPYWRIV